MASSERESSPPSLEELSTRGAATFLLPWIIAASGSAAREIVVFVDQPTRSITLVEGSIDAEALLRELTAKEGPPPASKASIESLPRIRVSDPGLECPICLAEYELNGDVVEAKEMPCRHRFHSDCIEKWLGIHGSCPVCRLLMPAEEDKKEIDERESEEREGWRIHVFFARRRTGSDSGRSGESGYDGDDELHAQDMEMDDIG